MEKLCLFVLGGAGYCGVELAWRGFTHWTMFVAGGAAFCLLVRLDARRRLPLWAAAALGALGATAIELAAGLFCRLVLHRAVWDYSAEWADLGGLVRRKRSELLSHRVIEIAVIGVFSRLAGGGSVSAL